METLHKTKITLGGKEYNSINDLPLEAQQAMKKMINNSNQNGVFKVYDENGKEMTKESFAQFINFLTFIFASGSGLSIFYILDQNGYKISWWISSPISILIGYLCQRYGEYYVRKKYNKEFRMYDKTIRELMIHFVGATFATFISVIINFLLAIILIKVLIQ